MFGLRKSVSKDDSGAADAAKLSELHAGCVVGFGFMQQKNISGKRIPVTEVNSYLFDSDAFISCRLSSDSADISLIVADEEDAEGTYLALSQRVDPRLFASLFAENMPQYWFALHEGEEIEAAPPMLGIHQGWLTNRYALATATQGRFLEGDYRLSNAADRSRLARRFEYVLLMDDDNEFALEAEKYADGTLNVFVTVYCPATDIGEVTRSAKSSAAALSVASPAEITDTPPQPGKDESPKATEAVAPASPENALPPALEAAGVSDGIAVAAESAVALPLPEVKNPDTKSSEMTESAMEEEKPMAENAAQPVLEAVSALPLNPEPEAQTVMPAETAASVAVAFVEVPEEGDDEEGSEDEEAPPYIINTSAALPQKQVTEPQPEERGETPSEASTLPVKSKFGRIQTVKAHDKNTGVADSTLTCDTQLAGRLIDEAKRNQMVLSELIRKVIDLPSRLNDQILIPFTLNEAETAELARRYQVDIGDTEGVKEGILDDLRRFAGGKI